MVRIHASTKKELNDYLLLKETKDHPDIYVNLNRLDLKTAKPYINRLVRLTGAQDPSDYVDISQSNTLHSILLNRTNNRGHRKLDPEGFLGFLNHDEADFLLRTMGGSMLPLPHFVEFLKALRSGEAYDGNGRKITRNRLNKAYNEITEVRAPFRAEHLNARFIRKQGSLYVVSNKAEEELDPDTLMKSGQISLENWLENPTSQGFPRKNVKQGTLCYWPPSEGAVSGFDANSGRAYLNCDGSRQDSYAGLRVRIARSPSNCA